MKIFEARNQRGWKLSDQFPNSDCTEFLLDTYLFHDRDSRINPTYMQTICLKYKDEHRSCLIE